MSSDTNDDGRKEGNTCLALGGGLAALGAGTALAAGAVCPLCIVAAPALIGYGLYKRLRPEGKAERGAGEPAPGADDETGLR